MPGPSTAIRVLLCDDVPEMRALMRIAFDADHAFEVVGEESTGTGAVSAAFDLSPDVVVMDLSMPEMDGLEAIEIIAKSSPRTAIVVFSGFAEQRMADVALARGAHRYVEKGEPLETLVAAVRAAADGSRVA
jgi:DNA-binding NarL/FixJ family response regulator